MAGVVNFIMRKDFEGIEVDGTLQHQHDARQQSRSQAHHRPGDRSTGIPISCAERLGLGRPRQSTRTLIMGANSPNGKGNVTAYVGYRNIEAILQAKRGLFCLFHWRTQRQPIPSGTSIAAARQTNPGGPNTYPDDFRRAYQGQLLEAHPERHFDAILQLDQYRLQFAPFNYLQRPDKRYTGGFFGHYEVNKAVDIFTSFMFMDDHTVAQIAPSGAVSAASSMINCDNPFLGSGGTTPTTNWYPVTSLCGAGTELGPTDDAQFVLNRRTSMGQSRITISAIRITAIVIGVKGDLGSGWSYESFAQYGTMIYAGDVQQ